MFAMGMGTGKSRVAIDFILSRRCQTVLIVCPKSVVAVWPYQFQQHCTSLFNVVPLVDGAVKDRASAGAQAIKLARARQEPCAMVINYESAWIGDMAELIQTTGWDAIILDESHRIKKPGGKASLFFSRLANRAAFRVCLTGTPMPHSPLDVYAQYRFLDKSIYGTSFTAFRSKYAVLQPIGRNIAAKKVVGFQNQDDLKSRFFQIAFQAKTEDVMDLPEENDVIIPVTISKKARTIYEQLRKEFVADLGSGVVTAGNALTRLLRLQQITSGYIRADNDLETATIGALVEVDAGKREALEDLLEGMEAAEPVVVFCRFKQDLDNVRLIAFTLGRKSLELSGSVNQLKEWQNGEAPILAVQIQSGNLGIDLTRSRYSVYYSLGFSLGDYLQSRRRISRPGQTRSTTNYHLIATKTIDEQVYKALEARQDCVEAILKEEMPR
jgi:SNF2 family DNA or RNA helicase